VPGVAVATPNLAEAESLREGEHSLSREDPSLARIASRLARAWKADAVCVTRSHEGALLANALGQVATFTAEPAFGDSCGAGDCFAVAVARNLAGGESSKQAVRLAVSRATEFVRQGGAGAAIRQERATPDHRHRGDGTVVATGGCFDLLHLGHVRTLEAAARLGDRLVVLLNSDRSVTELKGADRPLVGEGERAAMLQALACVDEVRIFDEPTPLEALCQLRPDVWAKGGDYELDQLPESQKVAAWGCRTVILPFLEGRSTTRLIEEAGTRATA
jgi:rfaE bifunctional protein nucleotidyltransferase chain/domain